MPMLAREASTTLRHLATAVDADRSARFYLDRGDGVMELVAAVRDGQGVPIGDDGHEVDRSGRSPLRRLLPPALGGPSAHGGATARLAVSADCAGLLVLERRRNEAFSDEDLALARVQARHLVGQADPPDAGSADA